MLKSSHQWVAAGALALLLAGVGTGLLVDRVTAARDGEKRVLQRRQVRADLARSAPLPSPQNTRLIEADVARAQLRIETCVAALSGQNAAADGVESAKPPATRTEAFFDLVAFMEGARVRAEKHGVALAPAAMHVGFSLYTQEGPDSAWIVPVFHQRLIAEHVINALFEARPRSLLLVQRERPAAEIDRSAPAGGGERASPPRLPQSESVPGSADYFTPDARFRSDVGLAALKTEAFRLVFTGGTETLRAFLHRLARFDLPVLVRSIEVQPLVPELKSGPISRPAARGLTSSVVLNAAIDPEASTEDRAERLIVPKSLSQFAVVVEFVERPHASGALASPPAPPRR